MGQGILIRLLQVAMTVIEVNVISGLPHLCTQRLEIFHRFSFAFSAFFAVEIISRLKTVQTKRTQRKLGGEGPIIGFPRSSLWENPRKRHCVKILVMYPKL